MTTRAKMAGVPISCGAQLPPNTPILLTGGSVSQVIVGLSCRSPIVYRTRFLTEFSCPHYQPSVHSVYSLGSFPPGWPVQHDRPVPLWCSTP